MHLLRNRNFAILFWGQLVSIFGNNLFAIALPWYVYTRTGSKSDLALVGLMVTLPNLAGLFVGVFVDRWPKRQTMIVSDLVRVVLSLILFGLAASNGPIWALLFFTLLLQLAGTVFEPAQTSLLPFVVRSEDYAAASGLNQSGTSLARMAGVFGGGLLITLLGVPLLFLGNALTFMVSVVSLFFVHVHEEVEPFHTRALFAAWREGISFVWHSKLTLRIIASVVFSNFAMTPFDIALTIWVKQTLGGTAFDLGMLIASFFVGAILGGLWLGELSKRVNLQTILMVGLFTLGFCFSLQVAWPNLYWDMSLLFIGGVARGALSGSLAALGLRLVPENMRGRVFGMFAALSTMTGPLGMAVFGWLILRVPLPILMVAMGVPAMLGGLSYLMPLHDDSAGQVTQQPSTT